MLSCCCYQDDLKEQLDKMEVKLERANQELQEAMQQIREQDQKLTDSESKVSNFATTYMLMIFLILWFLIKMSIYSFIYNNSIF